VPKKKSKLEKAPKQKSRKPFNIPKKTFAAEEENV
jgi:hypothetical protein